MLDLPGEEEISFYYEVGGHETFVRLVHGFFLGVRGDPELLAMYEPDLEGSEQRLLMFLEQYWGGPMTYSRVRGAPMLRMRHMPFKITRAARDRWVALMHAAIDTVDLTPEQEFLMRDYVERAATFLINAD